jgi:hypothetical protein
LPSSIISNTQSPKITTIIYLLQWEKYDINQYMNFNSIFHLLLFARLLLLLLGHRITMIHLLN